MYSGTKGTEPTPNLRAEIAKMSKKALHDIIVEVFMLEGVAANTLFSALTEQLDDENFMIQEMMSLTEKLCSVDSIPNKTIPSHYRDPIELLRNIVIHIEKKKDANLKS